jgi:hypothetical protein
MLSPHASPEKQQQPGRQLLGLIGDKEEIVDLRPGFVQDTKFQPCLLRAGCIKD